jgi:coenzyme PQQ synthesis protein D (PqqD)
MYALSKHIRSTRDQDGIIILDIREGKVIRLNATASLIFQRLQSRMDLAAIADELTTQFRVSRDTTIHDVTEFIEGMKNEGLIQEEFEGSPR